MKPTLEWDGYRVKLDDSSRLSVHDESVAPRQEVRCTVYLTREKQRRFSDYEKFPYVSATAKTAEEAELRAHVIYLRARNCRHDFRARNSQMQECVHCGALMMGGARRQDSHLKQHSASPLQLWLARLRSALIGTPGSGKDKSRFQ